MKRLALSLTALLTAGSPALAQHYDVLIRGGTVYDGSDTPGRTADVAIASDRIAAVGTIPAAATATTLIDASGKIVAPGFIDPHSHAAPNIQTAKLAAALPMLHQGITTLMINPDGGGPADLGPQIAEIETNIPGVNVVPLIGHNAVRRAVMGDVDRLPTSEEQAKMEGLVTAAMKAGAYGLSDGPFYIPAKYSNTAEIVGLARAAAPFPHAIYTSHVRDEGNYNIGVVEAVEEVITVAREAKIPGVVTHIKVLGPQVWGKSADVIAHIEKARASGVEIWADQYPYTASGSSLMASLVPGWAQEGGAEALAKRLQDPAMRAKIRAEMVPNLARRAGPHALMIRRFAPDPSLEGKRLDEIGTMQGKDPLDVAIDMLIQGGAPTVSFNMSDDDVAAFMRQPWTMTSTDGGLPEFGKSSEHPRAYGAFPRKLRHYVLDNKVIDMQHAIHAGTGLTAQIFAIPDRGMLREGAFADVIVFDPKTVRDVATYEQPHAYSVGMDYVFVNGKAAIADGKPAPERFGRVLLRTP
ncbi:N-acyl-D-amino-acid deacylase family protein [Sphingopyxis panaciterrulae]|uniref:N-acyl-D-amino-acid deacylase n=1 Tax=Sphingopyxis panaciterrulae TaxID=462372 RepID=A0A7W9B8B2_9SPHN|nr:amidohydrolase family protein [Sphingopyxis panaciterrulae]MBB5708056.1 N-acyl-D-amino-acid deacylase [Sphingopyxis panaciterrulae]